MVTTNFKRPKEKKCKICRETISISSTKPLTITSSTHPQCLRKRQKEKRKEKLARKLERKVKSKKFQKSEWKKWHKKCWLVFSEYVRRKNADWRGQVECYSCGVKVGWKEANAGHFHHGKLDFSEVNVRPQCVACNLWKSGNLARYATHLVQEIGQEGMVELEREANTKIYLVEELKEIHAKYTELLNQL